MAKITRFSGPNESPGYLLWKVSTKWRREIEQTLKKVSLTHPQFVLLASIWWFTQEGRPLSQVELATSCEVDITMTSQIVRVLEKRGLIEREFKEGNARSKYLKVTKKGVDLIAKAIPLVEENDAQFFKKLGIKEKQLIQLLSMLI